MSVPLVLLRLTERKGEWKLTEHRQAFTRYKWLQLTLCLLIDRVCNFSRRIH